MFHATTEGRFETTRELPTEAAIAISVGGSSHAVMMGSPIDLDDFAVGFLLSDGVISNTSDVEEILIAKGELGIDIQTRLVPHLADKYRERRRIMAGPVGCGLCGIENLELVVPELKPVLAHKLPHDFPWRAMASLDEGQRMRARTGAIHGAALMHPKGEVVFLREDIGRHNAVDKVIGAAIRAGTDPRGLVLVTSSRVSLDLVIKSARAGIGNLLARATPSDLAMQYAQKWRLSLVAPIFKTEYYTNGEPK